MNTPRQTSNTRLHNRFTARRLAVAAGFGVAAMALGGCVSQEKYDQAVSEIRVLTSRNADLSSRLAEIEQTAGSLRDESAGVRGTIDDLRRQNGTLRQELANANTTITNLTEQLGSLQFERLDPATDAALARLAERYPQLVTYDSERGMLQFSSDLTFDSGSAVVKSTAKQTLQALAQVLKSSEATQYDVRIVGHTDSQKPSGQTLQRHPTNVHLSVHRSIAVRRELQLLGVQEARLEVAGWGEFRPAIQNTSTGNTPANRRVELFLVPSGRSASAGSMMAPSGDTGGGRSFIDREQLDGGRFEPTK